MKLLAATTTARNVLFATVSVWIVMALLVVPLPNGVHAFSVPTQTTGKPLSRMRNSSNGPNRLLDKGASSSLGTFHRLSYQKTVSVATTTTATTTTSVSAVAVAVGAALPSVASFAAAAMLPSCLGLWRMGYAVSYGYGGSMAASGLLQLWSLRTAAAKGATAAATATASSSTTRLLVALHAATYVAYGVRLCVFLLYREIRLSREINQMKKRDASIAERLKRLPIITFCAVLYYFMAAAPMRVLSLLGGELGPLATASLAAGFSGFLLAAVGDWYKCKIKGTHGPQTLVTTGPFRFFRHPNYTGEILGWTCLVLLLPLLGALGAGASGARSVAPWLVSSFVGWAGVVFGVLAGGGDRRAGKKAQGEIRRNPRVRGMDEEVLVRSDGRPRNGRRMRIV
mmetsp:Transcript_923/g.2289  ORF Transcript_923/g.2289 Transcript_923/m.2289 type:complete len:398 (+) Transcript_923:91-1284(+)